MIDRALTAIATMIALVILAPVQSDAFTQSREDGRKFAYGILTISDAEHAVSARLNRIKPARSVVKIDYSFHVTAGVDTQVRTRLSLIPAFAHFLPAQALPVAVPCPVATGCVVSGSYLFDVEEIHDLIRVNGGLTAGIDLLGTENALVDGFMTMELITKK